MPRDHDYCIYILTNHTGTVLYIGVTSDLEGRLWERAHGESGDAIAREKQLKGWTRAKKEALIRTANPSFADLGALLGIRGACRQPEGPSAPKTLRSG